MQKGEEAEVIARAIIVRALPDQLVHYSQALFDVKFQFPTDDRGKKLVLKLKEVKLKQGKKTREPVKNQKGDELSIIGRLASAKTQGVLVLDMSRTLDVPKQESFDEPSKPRVGFVVDDVDKTTFFLELPDFRNHKLVLETEVRDALRNTTTTVSSPEFEVASPFIIEDDRVATYDWDEGNTAQFYSNASEGPTGDEKDADDNYGAFHDIMEAIGKAEKFIFIADWSFHPYARFRHPAPQKEDDPPDIKDTIGAILVKKAKDKPEMVIAIHTWDHTSVAAPDPQNDHADKHLDAIAKALDKKSSGRPANLLFRRSSRTGFGWSHHQKYVILDCDAENDPRPQNEENKNKKKRKEVKAFFGGLDLTQGRFDWWAHPIMPKDDDCKAFRQKFVEGKKEFDDWYNGEFGGKKDQVREPWHDIHAQVTGSTARDFVREMIGRWNQDPSIKGTKAGGNTSKDDAKKVTDVLTLIRDKDEFVQRTEARVPKGDVCSFTGQVYRSIKKEHWDATPTDLAQAKKAAEDAGVLLSKARAEYAEKHQGVEPQEDDPDVVNLKKLEKDYETKEAALEGAPYYGEEGFVWTVNGDFERSIQEAYVGAIQKAQKYIYIESQYLIGSGGGWGRTGVANRIPQALVNKIASKVAKGEDFHVYVVLPMFPEGGVLDSGIVVVRNLEWATMRYMAWSVRDAVSKNSGALQKAGKMKARWQDYLSFYFPARWEGVEKMTFSGKRGARVLANQRYMIYVHSKLMIVDDRFVILGSANLNERSLAGDRDTEICVGLTAEDDQAETAVKKFRTKVWSELMGNGKKRAKATAEWDDPGSLACVKSVLAAANANHRAFRKGELKNNEGFLCRYEFEVKRGDTGEPPTVTFSTWNQGEFDILPYARTKTKVLPSGEKEITWDVIPDGDSDGQPKIVTPTLRWNASWTKRNLVYRAVANTRVAE